MNKAFIFDMDGVLIDDEAIWEKEIEKFFPEILGEKVYKKLGTTIGLTMHKSYKKAVEYGATISKEEFMEAFYKRAITIYQTASITPGLQQLSTLLHKADYKIGLVTSSPKAWAEIVMKRIPYMKIHFILSLHERSDLQSKPSPDGYLEAMSELHAQPETTVVLEDANPGIASAKAAGAFVIGLRQNLIKGYKQVGADVYADTMEDVIKLILSKR